jgi:hypothetical protein
MDSGADATEAPKHMAKETNSPSTSCYFRVFTNISKDVVGGVESRMVMHVFKPYLSFPSFTPSPSKPLESRGKHTEMFYYTQQLQV